MKKSISTDGCFCRNLPRIVCRLINSPGRALLALLPELGGQDLTAPDTESPFRLQGPEGCSPIQPCLVSSSKLTHHRKIFDAFQPAASLCSVASQHKTRICCVHWILSPGCSWFSTIIWSEMVFKNQKGTPTGSRACFAAVSLCSRFSG